jgi:hypothetical protein
MQTVRAAFLSLFCAGLVHSAHATSVPADVLFLFDRSGSIQPEGWALSQEIFEASITAYVDPTNTPNRVAVMSYGDGFTEHFTFEDPEAADTAAAVAAVNALTFSGDGSSDLLDTMAGVITLFETAGRPGSTRLAYLMTDGSVSRGQGVCGGATYQALADAGVTLRIFGIGASFDDTYTECLVDDPTAQILATDSEVPEEEWLAFFFEDVAAPTPVPVPAPMPLLALGLGGLWLMRRRNATGVT